MLHVRVPYKSGPLKLSPKHIEYSTLFETFRINEEVENDFLI